MSKPTLQSTLTELPPPSVSRPVGKRPKPQNTTAIVEDADAPEYFDRTSASLCQQACRKASPSPKIPLLLWRTRQSTIKYEHTSFLVHQKCSNHFHLRTRSLYQSCFSSQPSTTTSRNSGTCQTSPAFDRYYSSWCPPCAPATLSESLPQ